MLSFRPSRVRAPLARHRKMQPAKQSIDHCKCILQAQIRTRRLRSILRRRTEHVIKTPNSNKFVFGRTKSEDQA
jgi:hypothetical protein